MKVIREIWNTRNNTTDANLERAQVEIRGIQCSHPVRLSGRDRAHGFEKLPSKACV